MLFLPLGITVPLTLFPGILMLIRVYAIYNRNKIILYGLSASLLLQTIAGLWEYTVRGGRAAPLPLDNYEYHFCIYLPPKRMCVFVDLPSHPPWPICLPLKWPFIDYVCFLGAWVR